MFLPALVALLRLIRGKGILDENPGIRAWVSLFFWAIFTHPLLDACTTYGTQLWQPFSDFRVALNNISVVDPLYTFPFLLCLLTAAFLRKGSKVRWTFNTLGLVLSSLYLLFTFYNKNRITHVFADSLDQQEYTYTRFTTSPTIFNNILWQGVAEGDTAFYHGMYSLLDASPEIPEFSVVPKRHYLVQPYQDSRDLSILKWFSNNYYTISERNGQLFFNDLRFGTFGVGEKSEEPRFVFQFLLDVEDGKLRARQSQERPDTEGVFQGLWERIKGIGGHEQ